MWRVNLTAPALNGAAVSVPGQGKGKGARVAAVFEAAHDLADRPARIVAPHDGTVTWVTDLAAAALLTKT